MEYDTIVCTEMLKHVDGDHEAIRLWRDGIWCIFSVPNFDWPGQVRYFDSCGDLAAPNSGVIDIEAIVKIVRPIVPDRRIGSYLRNLRWSLNNPSELLDFLGIQTFTLLAAWFLVYRTKC